MKLPAAAATAVVCASAAASLPFAASASAAFLLAASNAGPSRLATRPSSPSSRMPSPSARSASSSSAAAASSSAKASEREDATDVEAGGGGARRRHPLDPIGLNLENTWLSQLDGEDPSNRERSSSYERCAESLRRANRCSRPVFNGHYVEVKPTPLKNPRLVVHSPDVSTMLGLSEEDVRSEEFAKFFSGDVDGAFEGSDSAEEGGGGGGAAPRTWATPYALSIMGTRYTNNCPFGTGDGYGDGRAISVAEVSVDPSDETFADRPAGPRYELQLKGGGKTPFCRGADGRAVLRSSIREFLASEAMHHLGVKTTRALSLIVSDGPDGDTSQRPWYSEDSKFVLPSMDDPRLARFSDGQKRQLLSQLKVQSRGNPDTMIVEPNAITCRVAPSFVRVGHIDLFSRRATREVAEDGKGSKYDRSSSEWAELEKMIWHAAFREFPETAFDPYRAKDDVVGATKALLDESMEAVSTMVAGWVRVGFVQGNFNADNCLVGGRTMDYGPFGFVDEYNPLFAKWTGSGEHFGFLNQASAGLANFAVLVESVMPVIYAEAGEREGDKIQGDIMERAQETFQRKFDEVFRIKLGFEKEDESADEVWRSLEPLLRESRADWTLFWRRLTEVADRFPPSSEAYGDMLDELAGNDEVRAGSSPFHEAMDVEYRGKFLKWIQSWREALAASSSSASSDAAAEKMREANPKYVLREWMLVDAYNKAARGDELAVKDLLDLVRSPYDEGTDEQVERYYRRTPEEALSAGGTAYMS